MPDHSPGMKGLFEKFIDGADRVTPAMRDPLIALADMTLKDPIRAAIESRAQAHNWNLADTPFDNVPGDETSGQRSISMLHAGTREVALLQIDPLIARDARLASFFDSVRLALSGKVVRIISESVDAPSLALLKILDNWNKGAERIDAAFVPWRYVLELTQNANRKLIEVLAPKVSLDPNSLQKALASAAAAEQKAKLPPGVFISYAHENKDWFDRLNVMLTPIQGQFPGTVWSDRELKPGDNWFAEIRQALTSARTVVLLVSAPFLGSKFIGEHELGPVLKDADEGKKKILWVHVSACLDTYSGVGKFQAAHDIDTPLDQLSEGKAQEQLKKVAEAVLASLQS